MKYINPAAYQLNIYNFLIGQYLQSLLDKLSATELTEHRPFVALVPHVVG